MDTTIITGPVAENVEELTRRHDAEAVARVSAWFEWSGRGLLVAWPNALKVVDSDTLSGTDHILRDEEAEGLAEIVAAPDVAARTYTLDMGDGIDRVVAVYRRSDRFGYAWNLSDPRQSEYGYILD